VAIVGPDGAGKSSVAKRLVRELPIPVTYLSMGVNAASGNRLLPTTAIRERLRQRTTERGRPASDLSRKDVGP